LFISLFAIFNTSVAYSSPQATKASSQDQQKSTIGARIGIGFSKLKMNASLNVDDRVSLNGALIGAFPLNTYLTMHAEIGYTEKGAEFNSSLANAELETSYIETSVLLGYVVPSLSTTKYFAFLGPTLSLLVDNSSTIGFLDSITTSNSRIEDFDLGITLGIGAKHPTLKGALLFDLRYTQGFLSIIKNTDSEPKNRVISVNVGYLL